MDPGRDGPRGESKQMVCNLEKAREKMEALGLGALVAASPENVFYTSGCYLITQFNIRDRIAFAVIPYEGDPTLVVHNIEESFAREQSRIHDVRSYSPEYRSTFFTEFSTKPLEVLTNVLKEKGIEKGKIGLEKNYLSASYYEELLKMLPEASFVNSTPVFMSLRMIKTRDEIEVLRKAAKTTAEAAVEAFQRTRLGDTERVIARSMSDCLIRGGADSVAFLVLGAGGRSAFAHHKPEEIKIKYGDLVRVDVGGIFMGYYSDIVRSAVVGRDQSNKHSVYFKLAKAQREVIELIKPGVNISELYNACMKIYKNLGLKETALPHIGHGIGLEVHEYPMINPHSNEVLKASMVINIETFYFIKDLAGYHVEDTILVTNDGYEILTNYETTEKLWEIH